MLLPIIKRYPSFISFGIIQVLFTAPGQTFLIALFLPYIQETFNLSSSALAGIYSSATLSASFLLNPMGRLIDRLKVKNLLLLSTSLFSIGAVFLSLSNHIVGLFLGFFLLRLFGQGVFTMIAGTLLAKSFKKNRGKLLGIIYLGYPLSELIYPGVALWLLSQVSWQTTYLIFAASTLMIMLPAQLFLDKHSGFRIGTPLPEEMELTHHSLEPSVTSPSYQKQFTASDVLKDPSFYIVLTASCFPPLIMTGLFFFQDLIFKTQGWSTTVLAGGLGAYAISKAIGSVAIGPVVDRHGPLFPFISLISMLALGTFIVSFGGHSLLVYVYFSLMGAALGMSAPVMTVIWPTLYGTKHLGSIRGIIGTVRNGCTGFAPLPMAWALSSGITIETILFFQAVCISCVSLLPLTVNRLRMKS